MAPPHYAARTPSRRRHGRWQTWQLTATGITSLLLGVLLGAVASQEDDTPRVVQSNGGGPASMAASGSKDASVAVVGDKVALSEGRTVQVHAYESPAAGLSRSLESKARKVFVAIDVEGCAGPKARDVVDGINPVSFTLVCRTTPRSRWPSPPRILRCTLRLSRPAHATVGGLPARFPRTRGRASSRTRRGSGPTFDGLCHRVSPGWVPQLLNRKSCSQFCDLPVRPSQAR
jgi:hypothetical protein